MKPLLIVVCAVCLLSHTSPGQRPIRVITVDATINPATAEYIHSSIARAVADSAVCLVIKLNTPGGLLKSTRVIVSDLLTAPIPIVVYVAPPGAQSASAGAFITLAAHVAAMAPGTNIGAAHPVGMQGGEKDSIMNEKATNDAAAFIKTISEKRHRNVRWAEDAVRRSVSITETEALRDSVVDLIAPSVAELVRQLDGRTVEMDGGPRTLHTREAPIQEEEMDWKFRILDLLSDPNIAYIFLLLGMYGLIFELYNPGSILPGVVGVISIILAFYSLHTLPVNYAGLALIIVGIVLFLLEIKITSYGLLTVGGVLSLFIGSLMLIETPSSLEFVAVSLGVIIPAVLCTAAFFLFAVGMGLRAQSRKPTTGVEGLVGEIGTALTDLSPLSHGPKGELPKRQVPKGQVPMGQLSTGQVRVHGEIWSAVAEAGPIRSDEQVLVVRVEHLTLVVRKHSGVSPASH
jgi:membrane-bound serine protease (ClpP class)